MLFPLIKLVPVYNLQWKFLIFINKQNRGRQLDLNFCLIQQTCFDILKYTSNKNTYWHVLQKSAFACFCNLLKCWTFSFIYSIIHYIFRPAAAQKLVQEGIKSIEGKTRHHDHIWFVFILSNYEKKSLLYYNLTIFYVYIYEILTKFQKWHIIFTACRWYILNIYIIPDFKTVKIALLSPVIAYLCTFFVVVYT